MYLPLAPSVPALWTYRPHIRRRRISRHEPVRKGIPNRERLADFLSDAYGFKVEVPHREDGVQNQARPIYLDAQVCRGDFGRRDAI